MACEPGELDYCNVFTDHLVADQLVVKEGVLVPSERPGIGVEIDEDKLTHYRIDSR